MKTICIGNYPPRKCGIATFTENLIKSIQTAAEHKSIPSEIEVIAMNDKGETYDYPDIVVKTIRDQNRDDYYAAAEYINNSGADYCIFQHEYGIYGGNSGLLAIILLANIKIPIISTFHTVLEMPSFHQKEVLKEIARLSTKIVIMNSMAIPILERVYNVNPEKVCKIEHGVPDFSAYDINNLKIPDKWKNKNIILTFGLLGRNKGIETVLESLPAIIEKFPDTIYVILGKTHPHVIKHAGEEYRDFLKKLTSDLNLEDHVEFIDEYVTETELMEYLLMTDIYVTPYVNKAQITSGTLCYAVGSGSAVISTPYWHAEELLGKGLGMLFDFKKSDQLSEIIIDLLSSPEKLEKLKKNAFEYGINISWPTMGFYYLLEIRSINTYTYEKKQKRYIFPELNLEHIKRLTDDTGILQHATGFVANYNHGYCIDDNARALFLFTVLNKKNPSPIYDNLIYKYLSYILAMQNEDGSFKNLMNYDHSMPEITGSDDAFGRTICGLGALIYNSKKHPVFQIAMEMFQRAIPNYSKLRYARGYANSIIGLYYYTQKFPDQEWYINILKQLANTLCDAFDEHSDTEKYWCESTPTYDNGLIPASLYLAYDIIHDKRYLEKAERSRQFLEKKCFASGYLKLIGNQGRFGTLGNPGEFAQQPVDAMSMVILYYIAIQITGNKRLVNELKKSFNWFMGNNSLYIPVYDEETKGCRDGLEELTVSLNQGAESTIAYQIAHAFAEDYFTD